jgi:hypothetical protein
VAPWYRDFLKQLISTQLLLFATTVDVLSPKRGGLAIWHLWQVPQVPLLKRADNVFAERLKNILKMFGII